MCTSWGIDRKNNESCSKQFLEYNTALYMSVDAWLSSSNLDLKVKTTIANYSDRCILSQLTHRVIQFVRYILLFGHTEWNTTKKLAASKLTENLTTTIAAILRNSNNGAFQSKINEITNSNLNKSSAEYYNECKKLAGRIVKKIDISSYANKWMCDLLTINNANKSVADNKLNYQLSVLLRDSKTIMQVIVEKEAKKIAQLFVAFYEPNKAQQTTLLRDRNTFSNMTFLQNALTFQ